MKPWLHSLRVARRKEASGALERIATVELPSGGDYDHDVHLETGRVYLASTALDQVEVLDGPVALSGEPDAVLVEDRQAYVCVGDPPTSRVVDIAERVLRESIATGTGAKTSALDAWRGRLYVFLPKAGQAWIYAR